MATDNSEDRLSNAEVGKLKKWKTEREKEGKGALKEWVRDFLKNKLDVSKEG